MDAQIPHTSSVCLASGEEVETKRRSEVRTGPKPLKAVLSLSMDRVPNKPPSRVGLHLCFRGDARPENNEVEEQRHSDRRSPTGIEGQGHLTPPAGWAMGLRNDSPRLMPTAANLRMLLRMMHPHRSGAVQVEGIGWLGQGWFVLTAVIRGVWTHNIQSVCFFA